MGDVTVVFDQTMHGQQMKNVTVWNNFRDPEPDLTEFADAVRLAYLTEVAPVLAEAWQLQGITVIYNAVAPIFSLVIPFTLGPLSGNIADPAVPAQSALLVSTQFQGAPPNRGRFYQAGIEIGLLLSTGKFTAGAANACADLIQSFADGITTDTNEMFMRIGRRDVDGLITASSEISTVIGRVNPTVQRSRRIGQGA